MKIKNAADIEPPPAKGENTANKFYIPLNIKIYYHLIVIAGAVFLWGLFHTMGAGVLHWNYILFLAALTSVFLIKPFLILSEEIAYYIDDIPIYAAIFLLGPQSAMLVIAIGFLIPEACKLTAKIIKKQNLSFQLFYLSAVNISGIILVSGIAALVFWFLNKNHPLTAYPAQILAAGACALVKFFLNALESAFNTYLNGEGQSFSQVWKKNFTAIWVHLLMLAPLGFIFAFLLAENPVSSLFLILPVLVLYYACGALKRTLVQTDKIFQTFVKSIDRRDHYTFGHSQRVSLYAKAIAEEAGLPREEISAAERAGKIHDLGKIALSDDILQKMGKLDDDELKKMRTHSALSLLMFKKLHHLKKYIPAEAASLHHERYDGGGYPLGLKGEKIPLASRILAVADTFDAMTSERVYRKKISDEEAVARLREIKGTQLDPDLVDLFCNLHKNGAIEKIKTYWERSEKIYKKIEMSEALEEKYLGLKQVFS